MPKTNLLVPVLLVPLLLVTGWVAGCFNQYGPTATKPAAQTPGPQAARPISEAAQQNDKFAQRRRQMVERQLRGRDISDPSVLRAMGRVPRHQLVPASVRSQAYTDQPLPIGHEQTISQPYIVALMTQLAKPRKDAIALDVGTGSGYQAAVLAELVKRVYSIEIVKPLADRAQGQLKELGYENIEVRHGDGYRGWPEHAPFDVIIVAAAPERIPQPLIEQLAVGGHMVIPVVGKFFQDLIVIEKLADKTIRQRKVAAVLFVPMTGEAQKERPGTP